MLLVQRDDLKYLRGEKFSVSEASSLLVFLSQRVRLVQTAAHGLCGKAVQGFAFSFSVLLSVLVPLKG